MNMIQFQQHHDHLFIFLYLFGTGFAAVLRRNLIFNFLKRLYFFEKVPTSITRERFVASDIFSNQNKNNKLSNLVLQPKDSQQTKCCTLIIITQQCKT